MKKLAIVCVVFFSSAIFAAGCNLSATTPGDAIIPGSGTETTSTVTETDEPTGEMVLRLGATAGPTPTEVPAAECPPFAFDSLAGDLASFTDPSGFIGKHYNAHAYMDVVDGYTSEMLDAVHGWDDLRIRTLHLEFLERFVCHDAGGDAFFEVKDAQILNLAEDQSLSRTCWIGETPVPLALSIGHVDLTQPEVQYGGTTGWRYDRIDQAFLFDLEREKIAPLPVEGLVCLQPNEGGD